MEISKELHEMLGDCGLNDVQKKVIENQILAFTQDEIDKAIEELKTN